jgi:hypothetical protein
MADIDPDESRLTGGKAPAMPPGHLPEGYVPADQARMAHHAAEVFPPVSQPTPSGPVERGPFLDIPGSAPATKSAAWRWLLYALIGFLVGQLAGALFGIVAGVAAGKTSAQMTAIASASVPPEWYVLSTLAGLWVGFYGAPWLASRTQGTRRFMRDLGVRFRWVDLWGIAIGVGGQYVIALLYWPFQHDIHNFNAPGQKLTGGAHGTGFLVVALATVILAPFLEELFFRGLLFKALVRLFTPTSSGTMPTAWAPVTAGTHATSGMPVTAETMASTRRRGAGVVIAVVVDGLLFGLAHGEWVQLAGLALFGTALAAVSYRTGRLGMNMVAHASFNLIAILAILYQRGGVIH